MHQRKYAKWKAAYINNCLKTGETPHAGPLPNEGSDELEDLAAGGSNPGSGSSGGMGWAGPSQPNPYQPPLQPNPYQPPAQPYQPPAQNVRPDPSNGSLPFHLPDPPKDPEPKHPGGFIPYTPSTSNLPAAFQSAQSDGLSRTPEQLAKAQKYCKYTMSALTYDDVPTAIENILKCLKLLQTGEDS